MCREHHRHHFAAGAALAFAALALLLQARGLRAGAGADPDQGCLSCLCQAATGCDANRDCEADTCGMFAISRQYWKDAGAPGGDFETCALDPACATQCVQSYMQKFARDCDGDGEVGCSDYCRLHHLGREGCGAALGGGFASRLASCNASVPLGDFYARAALRAPRQGTSWQNGGGSNSFPQRSSGSSGGSPSYSFNPSVSYSRSVTVNPTYQSGGGGVGGGGYSLATGSTGYQNGQYQGGSSGYQNGRYQGGSTGYQNGRYQGGASGYLTGSGYQQGGGYGGYSGYEESGYRTAGVGGRVGAFGRPNDYREGYLWGAGESGGFSGGRRYSGGGSSGYGGRLPVVVSARTGTRSAPVSSSCLSCICNALTGCDPLAGCSGGGCGAFKLSPAYWRDCGSPGQTYEYCTRDFACSSSCARTYLTKYAQDCNGDGSVDCGDYARIHRLGAFGCSGALDEPYRSYVDSCSAY
ncbi:loricrin-like [Frankliniella occidentalis]|uniref:lysozyme n=1 Tax=Frankliniella occidentalis TaxID=133901 RepID=A0A6J1T2V4_FRAOC|nr:loricrin-like [Frankliniella occidentalis]